MVAGSVELKVPVDDLKELWILMEDLNGFFHQPMNYESSVHAGEFAEDHYPLIRKAYYSTLANAIPANLLDQWCEDREQVASSGSGATPSKNSSVGVDARSGHCLCGSVTATARGTMLDADACHCSMCRRQNAGGAFYAARFSGGVTLSGDTIRWY